MARCFKLLKPLPFVPAGMYFKLSDKTLHLSLSDHEHLGSPLIMGNYLFDKEAINLTDWFEEVETVPSSIPASTYFNGENTYWGSSRFYYDAVKQHHVYCNRPALPITKSVTLDEDSIIDRLNISAIEKVIVYQIDGVKYIACDINDNKFILKVN